MRVIASNICLSIHGRVWWCPPGRSTRFINFTFLMLASLTDKFFLVSLSNSADFMCSCKSAKLIFQFLLFFTFPSLSISLFHFPPLCFSLYLSTSLPLYLFLSLYLSPLSLSLSLSLSPPPLYTPLILIIPSFYSIISSIYSKTYFSMQCFYAGLYHKL